MILGLVVNGCVQPLKEAYTGLHMESWAYQLQDADPSLIATSGFDLVVIDYSRDGSEQGAYSAEEVRMMKKAGVIPVAYISIGEAESYRFYWQEAWYTEPPAWLGEENPEWEGNYAVRYWDTAWKAILRAYIDRIIAQGFSGLYLDKADEFTYWADSRKEISEAEAARKMIALIRELADYARERAGPAFYIIPQNGENILAYDTGALLETVDGWATEDLFYNGTERWDEEEMAWIAEHRFPYLDRVLADGKPVLSVDYVDDGSGYQGVNRERIRDYRARALSRGYIPYVAMSDRALDELHRIEGIQP